MAKYLILIVLSLAIGATMAAQPLINAELGRRFESILLAATFSSVIASLIFMPIAFLAFGVPSMNALQTAPWWAYLGGLVGVFFISASMYTVAQIGSSAMTVYMVAGLLIMASLADHYGLLRAEIRGLDFFRLSGMAIVALGLIIFNFEDLFRASGK